MRQVRDEAVRVGRAARPLKLGLGGIRSRHAQVLGDRAIEQVGVLGDDGHLSAQDVEWQLAQVVAVEQNAPLLRIDEAQQ